MHSSTRSIGLLAVTRFGRSRRIPGCLVLLQRRTGDDQHYQADADGVAELAHEPAPFSDPFIQAKSRQFVSMKTLAANPGTNSAEESR